MSHKTVTYHELKHDISGLQAGVVRQRLGDNQQRICERLYTQLGTALYLLIFELEQVHVGSHLECACSGNLRNEMTAKVSVMRDSNSRRSAPYAGHVW